MAFLHISGFDMTLGFMAYCGRYDVILPRCTSLCSPHAFSMGEASDDPPCTVSLTRRGDDDGESIDDRLLPGSPYFLYQDSSLRYLLLGACASLAVKISYV